MELNTVHNDNRGSINCLTGYFKTIPEVTIFETKKNYARGGCLHNKSFEHLFVIEGEILYVYKLEDTITELTIGQGAGVSIPPNVPHYFIAKEDCIVAEFGPSLEEKKGKDEDFRAIVNEINQKASANENTTV